jgi:ABC transporter with metal-binding/Fe-S-binding domain ATP-binding protein
MRLGVLFSGGKDSTYALFKAMEKEQVVCLISLLSENEASYMFHTPNIALTALQAQAIGLPLLQQITEGKKEAELGDLENVIKRAKEEFQIEGIVTGAVESVYQAERVQKICNTLNLWCFNPLWQKNQVTILEEIVTLGFWVIISGVFAYPFDETWLGRKIDRTTILDLVHLQEKYQINPAGEGGELETTVLDASFFEKRIEIVEFEKQMEEYSGMFQIKKARLVEK